MQLAFIDEAGTTKDPNQPYFGVGALFINSRHLVLNQSLRNVFLEAVQEMRVVEERFEFKFTYITKRSIPFYEELLVVLADFSSSWTFRYGLAEQPKGPVWDLYLALLEGLFQNQQGTFLVLADHLNRPRMARRELSDVVAAQPAIAQIVQLESQGSPLLQVSDVLLGALVYEKRNGRDLYKRQIGEQVKRLLTKTGAGIDPIYATPNT